MHSRANPHQGGAPGCKQRVVEPQERSWGAAAAVCGAGGTEVRVCCSMGSSGCISTVLFLHTQICLFGRVYICSDGVIASGTDRDVSAGFLFLFRPVKAVLV